ncbi:hypothetical protein GCM10027275_39780 [Rhabdobacter roseus]|uniref:LTD domain-containing protein n=1 Tax=Rhabdobacter roseus TaxID=1655419 RepID=A0A840TRZ6_9BACT|nr:lamin tail domain-containing protein [Rhabdobacter roseus]MBB5285685.1 hypothetical protein [Rhabdobacter roseus]
MKQRQRLDKNGWVLALLLGLLGGSAPVWAQGYNAVVVTELMIDPTPVVGLPDAEYLELYNRSTQPVSLRNWRLTMGSRTVTLPDSVLPPGSYSILCARSALELFRPLGRVVGLSSVSLPNAGATVSLRDARGQLIYSITYADRWWPVGQRDGGYALEMVDVENPCGELDNWRVSTDGRGGTPGQPNAVRGPNPDRTPPAVERVEVLAPDRLRVLFSERLDSLGTLQSSTFELTGRSIVQKTLETPSFRAVTLLLSAPLQEAQTYTLTVRQVPDCLGNYLREAKMSLGLPSRAEPGEVVLNEILFNPRPNGVDFVEIYNRTGKYLSLRGWTLGNVQNDQPANFRLITADEVLLPPYGLLALTTDATLVTEQYPTDRPRQLLEVPSLPSYPNAAGGVVLRDAEERIFDRFDYQETFHAALLTDRDGVSLERLDPAAPSHDRTNWHSAASTVGYATPGYANSQGTRPGAEDGFVVEPEAFTPDGDGMDDYAYVRYTLSAAGRVATIRIFDQHGRLIKNLVQNQLIGTGGEVRWDGTDERGELVRMGYYLLLIDTYDARGTSQQYKKRVVVVRR